MTMDKKTSVIPKRYFGLHMTEGVAEYQEKGKEPFRIFINEQTIKEMNPSFEGRPVFVNHITEDFQPEDFHEADGVVVKSFYNEVDGKNWVEFMVTSDRGHQAISSGWKLSNAYFQKDYGPSGVWHGVSYEKEIKKGEYEHLAIVNNPRYSESVILTPDEFKAYNEQKRAEIKKLSNSEDKVKNNNKEKPSMFKMFKRERLENAHDLENTMVELPSSKKEMSISEAITTADKFINMNGYANGDHMVKSGDEEMSVNDLSKKYEELKNKMKNMVEKPAEEDKKENEEEEDKKENEESEEKKENEDVHVDIDSHKGEAEDKKENKKAKNSKENFNKLKNASEKTAPKPIVADLQVQKLQRGKERY